MRQTDKPFNSWTSKSKSDQETNKGSANIVENTVLMVTEILGGRVDENAWVIDSACTRLHMNCGGVERLQLGISDVLEVTAMLD